MTTNIQPNDLVSGITYRIVYDDEMDEGINLVFHERRTVNQSYRLTQENYCLDEEEEADYQPKYDYLFKRENGELTPIAEVYIHYDLVKFYYVESEDYGIK